MRKWHRWLSVLFGLLILWITATGILSLVGSLANAAVRASAPPQGPPPGFVCPDTMICLPKPPPGSWNVTRLHHLHSGESFGALGTAFAMLSGIALIFFAVSGMWMYLRMFRTRANKQHRRGGKFFW